MTFDSCPGGDTGTDRMQLLVSEHAKVLLDYTEYLMRDRQLAEDIVQETLLRAWHHLDRLYGNEGSIRGWLLKVARNLAIDRLRSAHSRHETVGTDEHDVFEPDHADVVAVSVDMRALLRRLSQEHREVLLHTQLFGRTVQETANILGIPSGTVKSRRYYALSNLRTQAQAVRFAVPPQDRHRLKQDKHRPTR
ncbi:sigma-70 family RNA polymerase sigma factor [Streptomyces sp. NPDC088354]|uniref:sigma-70 family RNA polymerase sigma factor n=1 Tax=Streptomyces sp. NPDC088354 TaxID=3365856 RepID=UPI0038062F09